MGEMYDDPNTAQRGFGQEYLPEYLLQAQWAEMIELKKIIKELSKKKGRKISILDIGIGNARIPKHLCGIKEIWGLVGTYDGIDNSANCVKISKGLVKNYGIGNKVSVRKLDALELDKLGRKYDLIITTWFTGGNFYPDGFSFKEYGKNGKRLDLRKNPKFERIFKKAYRMLNPGGEIILGSVYKDNDNNRLIQEDLYTKWKMHVITSPKDCFTATREGFWSQRFTEKRAREYFHWVPAKKIKCVPLDNYEFSMMVRARK